MNTGPDKKIWVVARVDEGAVTSADVFCSNDDAQNFAGELSVDTNNLSGQFQVVNARLHCGKEKAEAGIDPEKFAEDRINGFYQDIALDSTHGAPTEAAGKYIVEHKSELLEECAKLIRSHLLSVLKEKGLLTK